MNRWQRTGLTLVLVVVVLLLAFDVSHTDVDSSLVALLMSAGITGIALFLVSD